MSRTLTSLTNAFPLGDWEHARRLVALARPAGGGNGRVEINLIRTGSEMPPLVGHDSGIARCRSAPSEFTFLHARPRSGHCSEALAANLFVNARFPIASSCRMV